MNRKSSNTYHYKGDRLYGTYTSWLSMRRRCYDSNREYFHYYGGRGIKVCDRWRNSFLTFYEDMGKRPEGKTLDRKDNDGDYEPGNCRWVTRREQIFNRSNSLSYKGVPLIEYCKKIGVSYRAVLYRVSSGRTLEEALSPDFSRKICKNTMMVGSITLKQYCKENNINYASVLRWMKFKGMTIEEAIRYKPYKYEIDGMSLNKYCSKNNINYNSALSRIKKGESVSEAVKPPFKRW